MLSLKFRRNLLLWLFALGVALIAIYILLNSLLLVSDSEGKFVNANDISKRFISILSNFGIEEKLIKENRVKGKYSGQEISNLKVQVPKDLSIPEILLDIYQSFKKDSLKISSSEKIKGGKSTLNLKRGNSVILQAEFDYSKNIFRDRGSIAFIIKDIDPGSSSNVDLIESPNKLNFLIRPESKMIQNLESIRENDKQFSILIDDEINEQKYKLGPAYSEQRVIAVVKTMVKDFALATCFIIDDESEFNNSQNREVLSHELKKRNIKLFTFSDFVNLFNDENVFDTFNNEIENLTANEGKVFLLSEDTYLAINGEIMKCKKKGYKVVKSSLLLFPKN